jgi:hypothetical protein
MSGGEEGGWFIGGGWGGCTLDGSVGAGGCDDEDGAESPHWGCGGEEGGIEELLVEVLETGMGREGGGAAQTQGQQQRVCTRVCMYTRVCMCIHVCIHVYTCVCTNARVRRVNTTRLPAVRDEVEGSRAGEKGSWRILEPNKALI